MIRLLVYMFVILIVGTRAADDLTVVCPLSSPAICIDGRLLCLQTDDNLPPALKPPIVKTNSPPPSPQASATSSSTPPQARSRLPRPPLSAASVAAIERYPLPAGL